MATLLLVSSDRTIASEASRYPQWSGVDAETVEQYARRVSEVPTQSIQISPSLSFSVRLVPATAFTIGISQPQPPPSPTCPSAFLCFAGIAVTSVLLGTVLVQALRQRIRPQFSLRRLLGICLGSAVAIGGATKWINDSQVQRSYQMELARYRNAKPNEKPSRRISIMKPFYIGECEVTQEQYEAIMKSNPSMFKGPHRPVETVSWSEAVEFCKRLSAISDRIVRLPTEVEWECAAKAGRDADFAIGTQETQLTDTAWYKGNSGGATHDVAQKKPNALGIHDMLGNVFEWCADSGFSDYNSLPAVNPGSEHDGAEMPEYRIMRGGSWFSDASECRPTNRAGAVPDMKLEYIGFRVVVELDK